MTRSPLYSRSRSSEGGTGARPEPGDPREAGGRSAEALDEAPSTLRQGTVAFLRRHERPALLLGGAVFMLLVVLLHGAMRPVPPPLTQRDIDMAVLYTLENQPRAPSVESEAYRVIAPSVVRVQEMGEDPEAVDPQALEGNGADTPPAPRRGGGLGTGVVVEEDGTILTNLHVVIGV